MKNSNDKPIENTVKPEEKPSKSSRCPWHNKFMMPLLMLLVIGFLGYFIAHQMKLSQHQQALNANNQAVIKQLQESQKKTASQLDQTLRAWKEKETEWQSQMNTLSDTVQKGFQQHLYQKQDWLLLKAQYYLELSEANIHWTNDMKSSIALLKQADDILKHLADSKLVNIRQSIAKEITSLEAVPVIDTAGLLSQLDALQATVLSLPFNQPINSPTAEKQTKNDDSMSWWDKFKINMSSLKQLVIIRHSDEDELPILSPLQQTLLRESIRVNLQIAELSIMQANQAAYDNALKQSLVDINRTFDKEREDTKALIRQITSLQKVILNPTKPDLSDALNLLNQLIDSPEEGGQAS